MDETEAWRRYKQAVLDRIGDFSALFADLKKQRPSTDGWVTALCPFHDDKEPSFAYNRDNGSWCCFAGCGKGSAFDYLMHSSGRSFKDTLLDLGDRYGVPRPFQHGPQRPSIREDLVTQWVGNLMASGPLLAALREKRGLTHSTLGKYQIGWDPGRRRYTIPVRDERGNTVNVRLYDPAKTPKIVNFTEGPHKYGSPPRLYGLDELAKYEGQQVIICEGEGDRLILQQEELMAVTGTHGCTTFRPEWLNWFKGKDVVILFDCDGQGQAAAGALLAAFRTAGMASIKNVRLPLRGDKDDKDVTDYILKRGLSGADLQKLIDDTPPHSYETTEEPEEIIQLGSFTEVERKDLLNKKVEVPLTVCGETTEAFYAVEGFRIAFCPRMQKGTCFECQASGKPIRLPHGAREFIGSCMSTDVQVKNMLRGYACRYDQKPSIEITEQTTVKEFFCHQRVRRLTQLTNKEGEVVQVINGARQELLEKRVYYLSDQDLRPGDYLAAGWVRSHPKTQQVTMVIESMTRLEDDYESFNLEKAIPLLKAFRDLGWEGLIEDLSANVTRVYERDELLLAVLLTYCSPRWLHFNGENIRGWLVSIIIGDSGSGKTQTYQRIADFANVGDTLSGLTGSRTGLAYALVEHSQKGWQVKVGRYPANTGKILIVDETQHLPDWDLRAISKAMEEGFLQIDRVMSRGYESQTRLILVANPRKDRIMDCFSFGCESLKDLFPPTVIRRADLAVFANSGDLADLSFLNRRVDAGVRAAITPEMLRSLIYWAWNLRPDQVIFLPETEEACLAKALEMSEKYGHAADIPLVTISDFRKKLARISAAVAVLTVSASDDFSRLIVRPGHVLTAVDFLTRIYSHDNCSLDDYSDIQRVGSQLLDYDEIERVFLEKYGNERFDPGSESYFPKMIFALRTGNAVRREDLAEQLGCTPDTVGRMVRVLKRFSMIESSPLGYVKKPKFNKFVRRFARAHPEFFKGVMESDRQPQTGLESLPDKDFENETP